MKITREALKNIVKETMVEESEYQEFFKKALEKAGKSIPSMSDEEKKAFFNKIEKTWKGRGKKNEGNAFGAAVAKAKKDGDSKFKVGDKEYKVERFGRGDETELDELTKAQEKLPPALKKAIEKKEGKKESVDESINEGRAKNDLKHMARFGNGDDRVTLANALEFGGVGNDKKDQKIMIQMIDKLSDKEARIALRNVERERTDESVNEGPSTEEKRIAMLAVRKQAKYRQVSLEQAIQDQINALEELKRDAKRGKIK